MLKIMRRAGIYAAFLLAAASVLAQNATIQGLVTDESKAVIPNAQITVTNIATSVRTTTQSNSSGLYSVPFLTPGVYRVAASASGFAPVTQERLPLDVEQTARVDFTLKIGAVAEEVNVSAAAVLIDSETSTVGQVISNKQIVDLPLNGRNYLELARLTTGVAPSNGSRTDAKGTFSALGQHGLQTNVMLDGVDNNSRFSGGQLGFEAQAVTPSIDSVQEFKVVTNNNSAEYGFRMGGTVIVSTKTGANAFHGSAYEFLRNDKLDAANFFAVGQPKPELRRNQFGGTIGGPVLKNRTFFFASYEGTRIRLGQSSRSTVPTQELRNGDFRTSKTIFDPKTTRKDASGQFIRDPFAGNQIPADRFDPVALKVISLYPLPNLPGTVNNNFFSGVQSDNSDEVDTRVDHNFNQKNHLFGRYSRRREDNLTPGPLPLPADGGLWTTTALVAHSGVANLNSTLTPALNNEVRVGVSKIISTLDIPWKDNFNAQLGIKGVPDLGDDNARGWARFSPTGYTEIGARSFWPNRNNLDFLQLSDLLLYNRGRHTFKTGLEFRRERIFRRAARFARGQFAFDGSFTQDPLNRAKTGDAMADFLLGVASGGSIGNQNGETALAHNYSAFFQDDWRVTGRLTLNLGVRWDLFGRPSYPDSVVSRLDAVPGSPTYNTFIFPKNGGDCGCENAIHNFAPRVGFAFQITPKIVIRSGYGIFYGEPDSISHDGDGVFFNQAPAFTEISFPTDRLLQPALIVSQGFPAGLLPATKLQPNVGAKSGYPFIPSQSAAEWFFDVQRQLPLDSVATISYTGSGTHHLMQTLDVNQPLIPGPGSVPSRRPLPFYASITLRSPLANASYQALSAKFEKRYSKGLTLLASYTWSHAIDDAIETDTNATGDGLQNNYDVARSRGNSVFDLRHVFVSSAVYDLPFGSGRTWLNRRGPLDWVLGGWQLGGIVTLRSGLPFTPLVSTDVSNTGTTNHPDRSGNGNLSSGRTLDRWFDLAAFTIPNQYTYGNGGRDILYGPRFHNADLKIGKNFRVTETKRIEFRGEMFNFTNTPHFNLPNANVNLPQGGKISSALEARDVQFGLKFVF